MLYVCATPIGNLRDVTLRVLDALRGADLIAAEDTRRTRTLLARHDIRTRCVSFHEHNEARRQPEILERLRAGQKVALVSDAGMPLVSDPGARLVSAALDEGLTVRVLPGPSAPLAALVASGLAGDGTFRFVGFLPRRRAELERAWRAWQGAGGVLVAFESPRRLAGSLATLASLAPGARAAVCRELTKLHEETRRGTLADLAASFAADAAAVRGEITLVVDVGSAAAAAHADEAMLRERAAILLRKGLSKRDAVTALSVCLHASKREAERLVREVAAGASAGDPAPCAE